MKSLRESLIFELHSSTYANAHDKEIERAGKETNRSRRFAVAAGKALTDELKKKGLIDSKTGKIKADKTVSALPVMGKIASTNAIIKKAIKEDPQSPENILNTSDKTITVHVPGCITAAGTYHKPFDVTLPNKKYVIYKDQYHNALHLASMSELLDQIGFLETFDDFEGFSPKDVVYTSNDPIEIIKYAVNKYGEWDSKNKDEWDADHEDDFDYDHHIKSIGTCDDIEWAQDVLDGFAKFDTGVNLGIEEIMVGYVDALVDDNGNVYDTYRKDSDNQNYKDYIKNNFE